MAIKTVTKLADGDLAVALHSGETFELSREDELFQAFAVWAMLNPNGDTGQIRAL